MIRGSTLGIIHASYRVIQGCRVRDSGFRDITPITAKEMESEKETGMIQCL